MKSLIFLLCMIQSYSFFDFLSRGKHDKAENNIKESYIPLDQLIPSSFITAFNNITKLQFYLKKKVNKNTSCQNIEFINMPKDVKTMKPQFYRLNEYYNQHAVWTNGLEYLSFVKVGDHGTWIVGTNPGVDDGFVYIRPKHYTLTPLGLEEQTDWKWSSNNEWKTVENLKLICTDEPSSSSSSSSSSSIEKDGQWNEFYFEISMFEEGKDDVHSMILLPNFIPNPLNSHDSVNNKFEAIAFKTDDPRQLVHLSNFQIICSMGTPIHLTNRNGKSTVARLINQELGGNKSWRLTFRRIYSNSDTDTRSQTSASAQFSDDPQWGLDPEIDITVHANGAISEEWTFRPLHASECVTSDTRALHDLKSTRPGDFIWAWASPSAIWARQGNAKWRRGDAEEVEEALWQCLSHSMNTWTFRLFPADRRAQMEQSALQRDAELIFVALMPPSAGQEDAEDCQVKTEVMDSQGNILNEKDEEDNNNRKRYAEDSLGGQVRVTLENGIREVHFVGLRDLVHLGRNILPLIRTYVMRKETALGPDLSACYLYHAGVSLPAPLVYAAEIICVLIGAKPVTMIQFDSDTDASWKFPLISELVNAIIIARLHIENSRQHDPSIPPFEIDYRIHKFRKFETIVFFRTSRTYVVDNILPRGTAQALHPMPFPDSNRMAEDHREQIFNAAWNGLILGYPARFVKSYCETFHNDLNVEEKRDIYVIAKREIELFLKEKYNQTIERIRVGLDPPISEDSMQVIQQALLGLPLYF